MTLTKAELSEILFEQVGLNKSEAKEMVEAFFEEIRSALEAGENVKLSDRKFIKDTTSNEAIEKAQAELPLAGDIISSSTTDSSSNLSNFKAQLSDILKTLK